ncbi:diaminopimelate decarboxylase [Neisseria sp. Ec49-e6-T10]|uniref:diaminopimelate decarboxylase n=1 Tax=Neisseria sp. Ec49-e6-T10 TaxID=3140744 RepID=UPI003EB830B4
MKTFNYKNQELLCDGVPVAQLAQQYGTPLYVYSEQALTDAYHHYSKSFKQTNPLICYAVKANGNLSILKHFAALGSGFDIVSGGELERVLAANGKAQKTIFSGVGKTHEEIAFALEQNILCFNVESINELDRIQQVALQKGIKAPISLRINPDVDAQTHPYISTGLKENKFGIAYKDALNAYLYAQTLSQLNIIGIDCHIGSQLLQVEPLIEAFNRLILLIDKLSEHGIHLHHIDMGGGLGIPYHHQETKPDIEKYAQAIESTITHKNLQLILEPGRSLVGNAGILLTQIEFIKKTEDKNFIIVDAAMNDLMRPSLYQAFHEIIPVIDNKEVPPITADIVGPICESGDFLGKDRTLSVQEQDYLAIKSAGAYASSMASNYNTRPKAAEVLITKNNQARLIRKRETLFQLLENEQTCL